MNVRFSLSNMVKHTMPHTAPPDRAGTHSAAMPATRAVRTLERRRKFALLRTSLLALCVAGIAVTGISALSPARDFPIVVTATPLPASHTITADDVRLSYVPADVPIAGIATSPRDVVGRITTSALPKDAPLQKAGLTTTPALPHGFTEVRISLASSAEHLTRGQHIRILAAQKTGETTVFDAVMVIKQAEETIGDDGSAQVVVGVDATKAAQLLDIAQRVPLLATDASD
jgi:hypothetical protein